MKEGSYDFVAARFSHISPLAKKLFRIEGVNRVFYGNDHIAISKIEEADWNNLKPLILEILMEHFTSKEPLFTDAKPQDDTEITENDSEVVAAIKEILDTRIRPFV